MATYKLARGEQNRRKVSLFRELERGAQRKGSRRLRRNPRKVKGKGGELGLTPLGNKIGRWGEEKGGVTSPLCECRVHTGKWDAMVNTDQLRENDF